MLPGHLLPNGRNLLASLIMNKERNKELTGKWLPTNILITLIDCKPQYSIACERLILKQTGAVSQSRMLRVLPGPCHKGT